MSNEEKALTIIVRADVSGALMGDLAAAADSVARASILTDYRERTAEETQRRQKADLDAFAQYLIEVGGAPGDFFNDLVVWKDITFGVIEGFKRWLVLRGYSLGTVNVRLATVKRYAELATQAGHITPNALALIKTVKGYKGKEARNLDEKRAVKRIGNKKAEPTLISIEQAMRLKRQENPRDRLLMCLLIDHGFRCGEVSSLKTKNASLEIRQLVAYRHKVNLEDTHTLSSEALDALRVYLAEFKPPADGFLFMGESAGGSYGTRAINYRVGELGRRIGIKKLSPHDLRHFWAWYAAYRGIPLNRLQQAGGWATLEMPNRYIGKSKIANEGMVS